MALLRILLELRQELGVVLTVAHFNHKIRGQEAEADQRFVANLAQRFDLEFHSGAGETPAYARQRKISLETAARELRHAWFAQLVRGGKTDKIATAHNQDDQAETVLMRILRGTGIRGLAGISAQTQKAVIRPLLAITRTEIEEYLRNLGQSWRDDSTNKDLHHARNRIRHELLPVLQRDYNPAIQEMLCDLAEVARAEEQYWDKEVDELAGRLVRSGKPGRSGRSNSQQATLALDFSALASLPLALQRRLLRFLAERLGTTLEFKHVQELLTFVQHRASGKELRLPGGLVARRSLRELQISQRADNVEARDYSYALEVPGQVTVVELGTTIRTQVLSLDGTDELSRYNSGLLDRALLAPELTVRNWRAGDRFFPAHTRSPKKVKELLQAGRLGHELSAEERKAWPVIVSGSQIVWIRGFPAPRAFAARSGEAVLIEELRAT